MRCPWSAHRRAAELEGATAERKPDRQTMALTRRCGRPLGTCTKGQWHSPASELKRIARMAASSACEKRIANFNDKPCCTWVTHRRWLGSRRVHFGGFSAVRACPNRNCAPAFGFGRVGISFFGPREGWLRLIGVTGPARCLVPRPQCPQMLKFCPKGSNNAPLLPLSPRHSRIHIQC
jgi:hypothetical protein